MKNLLLLIVTIAAFATTSCRKERTCKCNTTETDVTSLNNGGIETKTFTSSRTTTSEKQYKGDFRLATNCNSRQYTAISDDGKTNYTYVVDCDLK